MSFTFSEVAAASDPASAALAAHIAAPPTLAAVLDQARALIRLATKATGTHAEVIAARRFADDLTDIADELLDASPRGDCGE